MHERRVTHLKTPKQPKGRLWPKLVLLAAVLMMCFAALEVYVRLTSSDRAWNVPREVLTPAGPFTARLKPNLDRVPMTLADGPTYYISTNGHGFRGPEVASIADKPLKVVSLGDSFTFAWGMEVDEHAMARFVRWYDEKHPDHAVGHAFVAAPVWNPMDYYFAYLTEIRPTKPDVVVLGLFAGNDILPPSTPRVLDPADAPQQTQLSGEPPRPWLYTPGWLRARLAGNPLFVAAAMKFGYENPVLDRFAGDVAEQRPAWDTTFFYLDALAKAVHEDGGKLVVVSYPSIIQVESSEALKRSGLDVHLPDAVLGDYCRAHDLPFIPTLDALLEHRGEKLYWSVDRHMAPAGQTVVLDVLEEKLTPILDEVWKQKQR
jgi:hypothetical protein